MTRTRVRWPRVAAVALVGASIGVGGSRLVMPGAPVAAPASHRVYVVRPGDTLWGIAVRFGPRGSDPRAMVDRLATTNDVRGGLISPGERLELGP